MVTQPKPAKKPAMAPQEAVVFASLRNSAKLKAITIEKSKVSPKIFGIYLFLRSSGEKWFSFIQAFPKRSGEYQSPPIQKFESAATITANQLTVEISTLCLLLVWVLNYLKFFFNFWPSFEKDLQTQSESPLDQHFSFSF